MALVISINTPAGAINLELTRDRLDHLQKIGLFHAALPFLASPNCTTDDMRLPCDGDSWSAVVAGLVRQRPDANPLNETILRDRAVVILCGAQHQVERYDAGLLPEAELATLARTQLFLPIPNADFARWDSRKSIRAHAGTRGGDLVIPHHECVAAIPAFATRPAENVTADQWRILSALRERAEIMRVTPLAELAPTGVDVVPQVHVGWCKRCIAGEVSATTAMVQVVWNGRLFTREYSLEARL